MFFFGGFVIFLVFLSNGQCGKIVNWVNYQQGTPALQHFALVKGRIPHTEHHWSYQGAIIAPSAVLIPANKIHDVSEDNLIVEVASTIYGLVKSIVLQRDEHDDISCDIAILILKTPIEHDLFPHIIKLQRSECESTIFVAYGSESHTTLKKAAHPNCDCNGEDCFCTTLPARLNRPDFVVSDGKLVGVYSKSTGDQLKFVKVSENVDWITKAVLAITGCKI